MISLKTPLIFASTLIVVTLLLSWTLFDGHKTSSSDAAIHGFTTDNPSSSSTDYPPTADDVLVQRIPGDNDHLLMMAYYVKENYSGPSFDVVSGYTFRDDGQGDDQVAGDGFYTAKIAVDVQDFRKQVQDMDKQMKKDYKAIKYHNRERIADPNADESFDLNSFDSHQPTSVSGITLALPDYGPGVSGTKLKSANMVVSGATINAAAINTTAGAPTTPATTLDSVKQSSEVITNLGVVEDPARTWNYCSQTGNVNGPWTFGTLMRQLASSSPSQIASDAAVSAYVKNWLSSWETSQTINGDPVAARQLVDSIVLNPWLAKSQNAGSPAGQLNMKFAPFKLISIVNRFDMRNPSPWAGVFGHAFGEGRFVFCLIDANCSGPLQFTVNFEYRIHIPNTTSATYCSALHSWAQQWVNLKNVPLGSPQYNQALQNITDQFTRCGTNPDNPHQSSLDHLRTNEVAFVLPGSISPKRWELREFMLDNSGNLIENTVGQNPADKYDAQVVNADVQRMVSWINQNQQKIFNANDTLPNTLQGVPFLGGAARIIGAATGQPPGAFHWDGTGSGNSATFITDDKARHFFSLETCSGCHAGETQTAFTHINPAFFGKEAGLSGFLSGVAGSGGAIDFDNDPSNGVMSVKDAANRPSTNPTIRAFNDIDRRARDLLNFVNTSCGSTLAISSQLLAEPTNMVH